MAPDHDKQPANIFDGISLASFLQLLEQERKSCVVAVRHDGLSGRLYFNDGNLVDAEYEESIGLDAAYAILSWETPTFQIFSPEERIVRINQPLTRVLLTASTQNDESNHQADEKEKNGSQTTAPSPQQTLTPLLARIVQRIAEIPGLQHYYLLNKQGKVITKSSNNVKMGDFIAYCTVNGQQIREAIGSKGLHNIRLRLPDDKMLLIIPSNSITFGLLVSQSASLPEIYQKLRQALSSK